MSEKPTLGTFLGVFTPTILTILGVILYMRIGWILGHVGLSTMLFIVLIANSITLITSLSFSSISTNGRIGGGGAYYIISRSMGLEIGGAIGLPLFLSQTFSVTLYCFGLAESFKPYLPEIPLQLIAIALILIVGVIAYLGADFALKTQLPVMAMVAISIIMLAIGVIFAPQVTAGTSEAATPIKELKFWHAFSIFFPAVTGIMAGLGLSGDLKNPQKSIPLGAIGACLTGFAIYLLVPVLLYYGADSATLRTNPNVWSAIAPLGSIFILPGLWGAIFSSAIGSILIAPRTLEAMGRDKILPSFLNNILRSKRGSLYGLLFSLAIALSAVLLGELNMVAEVVSMFFLTVYGTVNIACVLEILSKDTSWRPTLKVPWFISLLGGLACFGTMFLINPLVSIIAITIEIVLYILYVRSERQAGWGDARRGILEAGIRWALIRLNSRPDSPRNFRPHILLFIDDIAGRLSLVHLASSFSQERGIVTAAKLVEGSLINNRDKVESELKQFKENLANAHEVIFPEVIAVNDILRGMVAVTQANGLAGVQSNTVMVGWPQNHERRVAFFGLMRELELLKRSFIIAKLSDGELLSHEPNHQIIIHVWWGGREQNSELMLLLAHLLTQNPAWRNAKIVVNTITNNALSQNTTIRFLRQLLEETRIEAQINVIVRQGEDSVQDIIHRESAAADIVFMGLAMVEPGQEDSYAARLEELAGQLKAVVFVKNSCMRVGELLTTSEFSST